jgi:hypothetical protein
MLAGCWVSIGAAALLGGVLPGAGDPGAVVVLGALGAATLLLECTAPEPAGGDQCQANAVQPCRACGRSQPGVANGLLVDRLEGG